MSNWLRAQELFDLTAELPPDQRGDVLREKSDGDEALVRQVEALIEADSAPSPGFDRSATDLLCELRHEPEPEKLCGLEFDSYRIDAYVSSGGMAHVYRATRSRSGTERRVALKVLRPGLDTQAFLDRFQRERETLAALEHEHVVAFVDAGAMPDGRPYLVMEFVEGVPISQWNRDASKRERLQLFGQVLAAVQYAHQRLVVHRDLKPSNVLVTAQGSPKLLDFGVSKALDAEDPEAPSRAPLTPAYASPEVLAGDAATTVSDVFSLGILLRQSLQGEDSAAPLEPDLEAIVAKATAIEPERRYRSPDDMGRDIERYLASEPVAARDGSWLYRARLYFLRQRYPLLLAASVVAASTAGWIGSDLDRRAAEDNAAIGWGAHSQARFVAHVYEEWLASVAADRPPLARNLETYLESALAESTGRSDEAKTLLHAALARLYLAANDLDRATEHVERASILATSTRGIGKNDRERIAALRAAVRTAQRNADEPPEKKTP